MTSLSDEHVLRVLRAELPPADDRLPTTDLWPHLQRRIQDGSHPTASAVDWLLAALIVLSCILQPSAIALLLFHI